MGPPPNPGWSVVVVVGVTGFFFSGAIGSAVALGLFLVTPRYRSDPAPGVMSVYPGPTWLHRWQLALPPEEDAVWLAAWLVSRLDPWMRRDEARALRAGVRALLDEVADHAEYRHLAPALPLAIWGKTFAPDHGHFFAYVPPTEKGDRLPLLIALHGHGGNAVVWLHAWRAFADAHRVAVVCPSFGYGNWEHPDAAAAVGRCADYAAEHLPTDPGRVWVAGLSQGGCGVGRAAAAFPGRFAGLVFLSGTMDFIACRPLLAGARGRPAVLGSPVFAGVRVFVAAGGRDHNVTPTSVDAGVAALRAAGADVTEFRDPGADHFLFFARRAEILDRIATWAGLPAPTPGDPPG